MQAVNDIRDLLAEDWIPQIYQEQVRPLRTRSVEMELREKENFPAIQYTLLGVELKVGRVRIACPDIGTARYLAVFARFGCRKVAVPYDITKLPELGLTLEKAWERTEARVAEKTAGASPQMKGRTRASLIRRVRDEVALIGAGGLMPLFNTSTRQRES